MNKVIDYIDAKGNNPMQRWLKKLRDPVGKVAIIRRITRLQHDHFGDHKPLRNGVWELRIDAGPGYRVYYAIAGDALVLLLCGSDKSKQSTEIDKACAYWKDWQTRGDTP